MVVGSELPPLLRPGAHREYQPPVFDRADGAMLLREASNDMGVALVDLVNVRDGDTGEVRRDRRNQPVAFGDGGDDAAEGLLVVAGFALLQQGLAKIRRAGADGDDVRRSLMADFIDDVLAPVLLHALVAKNGGDFFALTGQFDLAVAVINVYRQLVHLHAAFVGDGERQAAKRGVVAVVAFEGQGKFDFQRLAVRHEDAGCLVEAVNELGAVYNSPKYLKKRKTAG